MNKNALKGKARQGRTTKTGKLPDSFGFPGGNVSGGGVIRKLTKREREAQLKATLPDFKRLKEAAVSLLLIWDDKKARNAFKRKINRIFNPSDLNKVFKLVQL